MNDKLEPQAGTNPVSCEELRLILADQEKHIGDGLQLFISEADKERCSLG